MNQINCNKVPSVHNTATTQGTTFSYGTTEGISSTRTTLSSLAPTESKGFFERCSQWISDVIKSIRNYFISLFESDADRDLKIFGSLDERLNRGCVGPEGIDAMVEEFKSIKDPFMKMKALGLASTGRGSKQEIFIKFYETLPVEMQNTLKGEIYKVHGSSEINGYDHVHGFGDYMVYNEFKHPSVYEGIRNCLPEIFFDKYGI